MRRAAGQARGGGAQAARRAESLNAAHGTAWHPQAPPPAYGGYQAPPYGAPPAVSSH